MIEVKRSEDSVSGMLVELYSRASDILCLTYPPESDVLLSTAYKSGVVNWTELEGRNIVVCSLLGDDLWFLLLMDTGDIPNYDSLFVPFILTHTCQVPTIW